MKLSGVLGFVLSLIFLILYTPPPPVLPTELPPPTPTRRPPPLRAALPILVYHHVDTQNNLWSVTPQNFEAQLQYLQVEGYVTVSLSAYLDHLSGVQRIKNVEKTVILTFDDGYLDNYTIAFPLLRRYGYTGTFFISSQKLGQKGYMTWEQAAAMVAAGMEMGGHTRTHPKLTTLGLKALKSELEDSRRDIEDKLGVSLDLFAYPFNDRNLQVVAQVQAAGYRGAVAVATHNGDTRHDPYTIPRITIANSTGIRMFSVLLKHYQPLP